MNTSNQPELAVGAAVLAGTGFHRRLIEGMRCGILTIDRAGNVVMLNDHARQILELDPGTSEGASLDDVLAGHPQLAQILRESFAMASLPNRAEIDLRTRSECGKTIGFTLSLVPGAEGRPQGAAIFFKDLTHVEHKEEQERLKDRLAALGQMAANLAHEIRNPLASIEVSCSLLKRRLGDEATPRDLLDKIIAEVRRLNRTITSSLEFVRPVSLSLTEVRLPEVLDEALTTAIGRRGRPEFRVVRNYAAAAEPILVDRGQIRQVFENLFLNAMEAMGDSGTLTVETDSMPAPAGPTIPYRSTRSSAGDPWAGFERYAVVRVADTGCGISEEHADKLFYPFFTTKKQGSGVGLAVARKIVDSHRGLIDMRSRPGEGTVFTVRLPIAAPVLEGATR